MRSARHSPRHRLAHARQPYHLAAVDAGRHRYRYLFLFFVDAFAAAGLALFLGNFALAFAVLARLDHGDGAEEGVAGLVHLARAVAVLADKHLGAHHRARALAGVAHAGLSQEHAALDPEYRIAEADLEVNGDVAGAGQARRALLPAEEVGEDVPHVEPSLVEGILKLRKVEPRPAKSATCRGARSAPKDTSVAVVLGALFVVAQNRVGFGYFFKLVGVALLFVGVEFVRQLVERSFYVVFSRGLCNSQQLVVIALISHRFILLLLRCLARNRPLVSTT